MVKKVTITDREYRLLKRTNSAIQKNVNFLEAENRKNKFYYDCLWESYCASLNSRDALNRELNSVHHQLCDSLNHKDKLNKELNSVHDQLYDETYCSSSLRHELDELNKKYIKLVGDYECLWCKYDDQQTIVKEEDEEKVVKPWSGRIL